MRDEEVRKKKQTNPKNNIAPKAVTFPKKNELPRVGLEPTTLYTLDRVLYHYKNFCELEIVNFLTCT